MVIIIRSNPKTDGINILILHAYWNNRGDESAIRAMIDSLKEKISFKQIELMTTSENVNLPYNDVRIIDQYPYIEKKISNISVILDIFLQIITLGNISFTKKGKDYLNTVDNADIVIHAPGGSSIGDLETKSVGIIYLYRLFIPVIKRKPLFFYAPSMGPFNNKILNIFRKFILNRSRTIIVRENISAGYLKDQLNLDSYVAIDSAFQNNIPKNYLNKFENINEILHIVNDNKTIGLVIDNFEWYDQCKKNGNEVLDIYLKVAEYLIKKGYHILLIPNLFNADNFDSKELLFLKYIYEIDNENISILPINVDAYGQQVFISKLFCVISARYHPIVYAAKAYIPFISLSYHFKINGLVEKLECQNLLIEVKDMNENIIINKFEHIEKNYDKIQDHLRKKVPFLQEKSKKITEILLNELKTLN